MKKIILCFLVISLFVCLCSCVREDTALTQSSTDLYDKADFADEWDSALPDYSEEPPEESESIETETKIEMPDFYESLKEYISAESNEKRISSWDSWSEYRTDITYETLVRYPIDFMGYCICYTGTVLARTKVDGTIIYMIGLNGNYDEPVRVEHDSELLPFNVLVDDTVSFWGIYLSYDSDSMIIPVVVATKISLENE